jgi:hypothetical protein
MALCIGIHSHEEIEFICFSVYNYIYISTLEIGVKRERTIEQSWVWRQSFAGRDRLLDFLVGWIWILVGAAFMQQIRISFSGA